MQDLVWYGCLMLRWTPNLHPSRQVSRTFHHDSRSTNPEAIDFWRRTAGKEAARMKVLATQNSCFPVATAGNTFLLWTLLQLERYQFVGSGGFVGKFSFKSRVTNTAIIEPHRSSPRSDLRDGSLSSTIKPGYNLTRLDSAIEVRIRGLEGTSVVDSCCKLGAELHCSPHSGARAGCLFWMPTLAAVRGPGFGHTRTSTAAI